MVKLVKPFYMLLLYPRSGNPANRYTSYLLYILPTPKFYHIWPIGSIHSYPFITNTNNIDENQTIWFWKRNIAGQLGQYNCRWRPCALHHDGVINWNNFRDTGLLCREFTGHRWIPLTTASDAELWCFFYLRLNQQLSKQWRRRRFETPSCSS